MDSPLGKLFSLARGPMYVCDHPFARGLLQYGGLRTKGIDWLAAGGTSRFRLFPDVCSQIMAVLPSNFSECLSTLRVDVFANAMSPHQMMVRILFPRRFDVAGLVNRYLRCQLRESGLLVALGQRRMESGQ